MKIGDKVYKYDNCGKIYESTIIDVYEYPIMGGYRVVYDTENIAFDDTAIGKSVFMSEAEAKKAFALSIERKECI